MPQIIPSHLIFILYLKFCFHTENQTLGGGFMILRIACGVILLLCSFTISEMVVGSSALFYFPGDIGTKDQIVSLNSFVRLQSRLMKNGIVLFTWSMHSTAKTGALSIYSLSGRRIKSISLVSSNSFLKLDAKKEGLSNGIYFATLEVGS